MSISISAPDGLDDATVEAVHALVARSNAAEEIDLAIPPEVGAMTSLLMAYLDGRLAGAASLSHGPEAEISLCVDPALRRRGVGRELARAARMRATARGAGAALFVADLASMSGRAFAAAMGASQSFAEHRMDLDLVTVPPAPSLLPGLAIRAAGPEDAPALVAILAAAFGDPPAIVERFVGERISVRSNRFLIGELEGRPVGTLRVVGDDGWSYVTTFGVLPELHGRGVGRRMLLHAIGRLRLEGQAAIRIEVETTNAPAIGLYESCGFRRARTFAYLTLPDEQG